MKTGIACGSLNVLAFILILAMRPPDYAELARKEAALQAAIRGAGITFSSHEPTYLAGRPFFSLGPSLENVYFLLNVPALFAADELTALALPAVAALFDLRRIDYATESWVAAIAFAVVSALWGLSAGAVFESFRRRRPRPSDGPV
jgi:hypothetical protein